MSISFKPPADPIERIIYDALVVSGIPFIFDNPPLTKNLDFFLPDFDCYIECKAYHTERTSRQMARVQNIIVVQGIGAARMFAEFLRDRSPK